MIIGLLQLNYIVGDLEGNAKKIIESVRSLNGKVDLCVTSELALLGYPPRDLLLHQAFIEQVEEKLNEIAATLADCPALLLGTVVKCNVVGKPLYNAAVFIENGYVQSTFHKTLIPTYDVFDEDRYFQAGTQVNILEFKGERLGITICEDMWNSSDHGFSQRYINNPIAEINKHGVDCIINMSASPYTMLKHKSQREILIQAWIKKYNVSFIYVNQVGGNDDIVFDGNSCLMDDCGTVIAKANAFSEEILIVNTKENSTKVDNRKDTTPEEEVFNALVCGTRDYIHKCGFNKAVLGLSGGIDSALTLAIAVEAIGSQNVIAALMPSPYSSQSSLDDAHAIASSLNVQTYTLPISDIMQSYNCLLSPVFSGMAVDTTEENLQARIRGNLLMALSNKFGALLLTTGNKSELSVGYCTIYGDMCGGLAVISDVYKTMVYKMSHWFNQSKGKEIIPKSTLTKPPSAELRPDQKDQDSLPEYEVLDDILVRYIEKQESANNIISQGHDAATVKKVLNLVVKSEFKRRQAAPGLKITSRAYGTGWRMPIAAKYNQLHVSQNSSYVSNVIQGRFLSLG